MSVRCEGCGKRYRVKRALAGKRTACKACGATMVLVDEAEVPAPADDFSAWGELEKTAGAAVVTPVTPGALSPVRPTRGDYVDLPGEGVIDRLLPWVTLALFLVCLGVVAARAGSGRAAAVAIGVAAAVAGVCAPLGLLGVWIASRLMNFRMRPGFYVKCLGALCALWAVSLGLSGFDLGAGLMPAWFFAAVPVGVGVLWLLLRLRAAAFAVAAGAMLALGVGLPAIAALVIGPIDLSSPPAGAAKGATAKAAGGTTAGAADGGAADGGAVATAAANGPLDTLEGRLSAIRAAFEQYAAAHDGLYPETLEQTGRGALLHGWARGRGDLDLHANTLGWMKAPLPARLIVASGMGDRGADGRWGTIAVMGDGSVRAFDAAGWQAAQPASADAAVEAMLWLADDASTPQGAVVGWFVAHAMGDAAGLEARTCNVDPALVRSAAGMQAGARALVEACVKRFPAAADGEPRPPKTRDEVARLTLGVLRGARATVEGERARVGDFQLRRDGGRWQVDATPMFDRPTPLQAQLGAMIFDISARASRETAAEVAAGAYASFDAAKDAVTRKMGELAKADAAFQAAARAHPDVVLPRFAMLSPWDAQRKPATAEPHAVASPPSAVAKAPPATEAAVQEMRRPAAPAPAAASPPAAFAKVADVPGAAKTAMAGGTGGMPFERVSPTGARIVGFRHAAGNWGGRAVLARLDPIFQGDATSPGAAAPVAGGGDKVKTLAARDGYVVGGVLADYDDVNVVAVRVTFVRESDPKDRYESEWVGKPAGKRQVKLAGDGGAVVGVFGRQGMNLDGFGLVTRPAPAAVRP